MAAIMRQIAELLYNDYEANQADTEEERAAAIDALKLIYGCHRKRHPAMSSGVRRGERPDEYRHGIQ